jgi:hypothetical protein
MPFPAMGWRQLAHELGDASTVPLVGGQRRSGLLQRSEKGDTHVPQAGVALPSRQTVLSLKYRMSCEGEQREADRILPLFRGWRMTSCHCHRPSQTAKAGLALVAVGED